MIVSLALAAEPGSGDKTRALSLFEESAVAYREGRFEDAIRLLREARALKPEPVLLYNLGRAYEAAGRRREAADAYERYLAEEPRAADRGALEGRVASLRREEAERDALLKASKAEAPAAPPRESESPLPFVITGVGVAGVAAGLVVGIAARSRADDARAEPVQARAAELHDDARGLATVANLTLVAGAVLTVVGGAWLGARFLRPQGSNTAARGLVWAWP